MGARAACRAHPHFCHRDQFSRLDGSRRLSRHQRLPLVNDLGHALVLFEILGQHLLHPKVDMAEVWNTRWTSPAENQLWNTLNEKNGLNATGQAIAL